MQRAITEAARTPHPEQGEWPHQVPAPRAVLSIDPRACMAPVSICALSLARRFLIGSLLRFTLFRLRRGSLGKLGFWTAWETGTALQKNHTGQCGLPLQGFLLVLMFFISPTNF